MSENVHVAIISWKMNPLINLVKTDSVIYQAIVSFLLVSDSDT